MPWRDVRRWTGLCLIVFAGCGANAGVSQVTDGSPPVLPPLQRDLDPSASLGSLTASAPAAAAPIPDDPSCAALGARCQDNAECCAGLECFKLISISPAPGRVDGTRVGICSAECQTFGTCPPGFGCSIDAYREITPSHAQAVSVCARSCTPNQDDNPCSEGLACNPYNFTRPAQPPSFCTLPACTTDADCPVVLSRTCDLSAPHACADVAGGAYCVRLAYELPRCAIPGKCRTETGLCAPHPYGDASAKVGDPCDNDLECGGQMRCLRERAFDLVFYRNGYCTIRGCGNPTLPERACPAGSICASVNGGGECRKTCDLEDASSCRGVVGDRYGDYECYHEPMVASVPVCDSPSDFHYQYWFLYFGRCEGLPGNPTHMEWRDPRTGEVLERGSPHRGFCLDDTASGPL